MSEEPPRARADECVGAVVAAAKAQTRSVVPTRRALLRPSLVRSSFAQQAGHYDVLSLAGGLVGIALACAAPATPLAWTLARCVQLLRTRHFKVAPHLRIIVKLINQIIQQ